MPAWNEPSRASTEGLGVERADRVVEQEGRGRPQADQRRRARVAAAVGRHLVLARLAGDRMVHRDRADRRQALVGLRGEIVPDVAGDRVGGERAAGVGLQQRHRHAELGREVVAVEEIRGEDDLLHLRLVLVGLGPRPVLVPALQVVRPGAAARVEPCGRRRAPCWNGSARSARRTRSCRARAPPHPCVRCCAPPGRVGQLVGPAGLEEVEGRERRLRLGRLPVAGLLLRDGDLDRRDRLAADDRVEVAQPLLAVEADVEIDPVQRTQGAHRIGAVLQHARRVGGVRRLEQLGERPVGDDSR